MRSVYKFTELYKTSVYEKLLILQQ